jgi:methionine aminotransferase
MNGAKAVPVALSFPGFQVDWQAVKKAVSPKTKAIIINTPHNPTGAVWTQQDWDQLTDIVNDTDIIILADEVYEQLVFDGRKHLSVLQQPALRHRSFAIYSFGKVFNNTGWKVGYVVAPEAMSQAFRHIHQYLCFSVNTPAQYAIAQYLQSDSLPAIGKILEEKRNYFLDLFKDLPFTISQKTSGSYFQIAGYENISDMDDVAFAKWLTKEYGVATIPLSPFYSNKKDDHLVRFCFAKKETTLMQAAERLKRLK